ncbi:Protein kinase domain-containing protein [Mycena sanguinolenta]|uniref:Protein kinase domain-containing protein n=1 Tax=Mycena sanguinolenta TaxID=230812 RepID=A0A8H6Z239_9AGAR|nr:Protein kinase domain-containing protein [Mycena sanguinolenta]
MHRCLPILSSGSALTWTTAQRTSLTNPGVTSSPILPLVVTRFAGNTTRERDPKHQSGQQSNIPSRETRFVLAVAKASFTSMSRTQARMEQIYIKRRVPTIKMAYDVEDRVCALKALHNSRGREEIDIITFLNSPNMRACADNHTIPILDTIVTEEWSFIVMPYLPRPVHACIPWEVDDHFNRLAQALEGLSFMHRHGIIHRDISVGNMLLNVHYGVPGVYSPFTKRNIALAFIDYGCAHRFPADSDPNSWLGSGQWGSMDHAAPEIPRGDSRNSRPYHLPPVDVYALGSVFTRALSWERIYCKTFGNPDSLPTAAHQVLQEFVPGSLGSFGPAETRGDAARPFRANKARALWI